MKGISRITLSLFLIFIFHLVYTSCHFCGSGLLPRNKYIMEREVNLMSTSTSQASDYQPLRIYVDTTFLESQNIDNEKKSKAVEYFQDVVSLISKLLSVQPTQSLKINFDVARYCYAEKYDPAIKTGIPYDLVLFPFFGQTINDAIAESTACASWNNGFPTAGYLRINTNVDFSYFNSEDYIKNLFLHEIFHVLGFTNELLEKHVTYKEINGLKRTLVNSPKVLEKARLHFGCDNIEGVELENYGGLAIGSHWESRIMLGELMTPAFAEKTLSDITLAFLEDIGFYKVNYYTGGLFRFGKGEGCDFLNKKCINENEQSNFPREYCTEKGKEFCTTGRQFRGICRIYDYRAFSNIEQEYDYFRNKIGMSPYPDWCPFYGPSAEDSATKSYYKESCAIGKELNSGDKIGENSSCYVHDRKAKCYETQCDSNNKKVIVTINGQKVECPTEGGVIELPAGLDGSLDCPDYNQVCTASIWCNNMLECIRKESIADLSSYVYSYERKN